MPSAPSHPPQTTRPAWLSSYIPELDGLRGIAILLVVFYHCETRISQPALHSIVQWGWAGVNLFFVLSGFLITGIILDSRDDPSFFKNFYARRSLRIWPVYFLLLALEFAILPLIFGGFWWSIDKFRSAPWPYLLLFVQNLFVLTLPGSIGPTWSLAIEEQFYVVWAPLARFIRNSVLIPILLAVIIASPFVRAANHGGLTATNTLIHLDGIAFGSLIAASLRTLRFTQRAWRNLSLTAFAVAIPVATYLLYRGSAFSDSFLALLFAGMLLLALTTSGQSSLYTRALRIRPLRFYGKISYGLYMIHILVFSMIGVFDLHMDKHGPLGNLAIVSVRIILSTLTATALWYGFERPILKLKQRFHPQPAAPAILDSSLSTAALAD